MSWKWVLVDAAGREMRATEGFESQQEAETWMSVHWSELAEEGAASVSLREEDTESYLMSLASE